MTTLSRDCANLMEQQFVEVCAKFGADADAQRAKEYGMTRDDFDDLYFDCEANAEGQPRYMVRYAYEAGYAAALKDAQADIADLSERIDRMSERLAGKRA